MNDNLHWSEGFPGSEAADNTISWLNEQLERIREGNISEAKDALQRQAWRRNVDLTGMPTDVREGVSRLVDVAWDALREPVEVEAATRALGSAVRIIRRDGE